MTIIQPRKLRHYRRLKELSQSALGQYLGVSQATINRYERGWTPIPAKTLNQLASLLETTPVELLAPWDIPAPEILKCVNTAD